MKQSGTGPVILAALAFFVPAVARASDHNNIDAGRPLRFEDAEPIAFGERNREYGLSLGFGRGRAAGLGLSAEYLVGFALNAHYSVEVDASLGGRVDADDTRFDVGDIGLGVLYNLNREYNNMPALGVRADALLPTGRGSRGVDFRLRGIASRHFGQFARLHLNLDAEFVTRADDGERGFRSALTLGYSAPLGYPTRFDRTGLAEVSLRGSGHKGEGGVVSLGVGVRQQVTPRSVVDIGVQSDVTGFDNAPRETLRLIAGYSTAF